MKLRAALVAGTALVGAAAWLPLTSLLLHGAVPRAEPPSLILPFPAYYYWRDYRNLPPIRRWLPPSAAGAGVLALAPALLVGCAPGRRRRLTTAQPGEPVPEVERARSKLYGNARKLTHAEAKRRSRRARWGCVVIGKADDGTLLTDDCKKGAGHWNVFAGSGAQKTSSITVPTLVPDVGWCGPVLVFDPAGELSHMTRDVREAAGQRVIVVSPDPAVGQGFNALDWIDIRHPLAGMHVEGMVEMIGKERPKQSTENPMWRASGKTIQEAVMLDMLWNPNLAQSEKTLARFARVVMEPEKELRRLLMDIHAESASEKARLLAGTLVGTPERQFGGYYSDARTDVKWLTEPAFAQMVCGSAMRSDELARGGVSVYVEIPMDVLQNAPEVGRTVLHAMFKGIYRHRGRVENHILGILEDVDLLGDLQVLREARDNARKYGLHLLKLRQATGQVADTLGIGGKSSEEESSTGQIYIGIQNKHTAEEVSARCGTFTGMARTENTSTGRSRGQGGSSNSGRSEGVSLVQVPVVRPYEVQQADGRFVFRGKDPVLECGNPVWWERPEMIGRIKPSPFLHLDAG